jgi:phosphoglycerate dehydrogenase-like enzyme
VKAWLPFADAAQQLGEVPPGVDIDVYDGEGAEPASIDDVEFYVLPYTGGPHTVDIAARMPRLQIMQTLTAGVDHVLGQAPDGVTLCNARGVHDASTAELALTLMLAALRQVPEFVRAQQRAEWVVESTPALADKSVLIVGYGSIGAAVEHRLAGFEVTLLRVARSSRDGVAGLDELPDLLPQADVVVLTVPLSTQTRGMVDAAFLARMRDGALLVNVARGAVVDTDALLGELSTGRLQAALDVTDPEPLPADHPLWRAPGLLLTPHVGGNTSAFLPRALRLVREQLRRHVAGEPLANIVDT